jgi:hypothetical protein
VLKGEAGDAVATRAVLGVAEARVIRVESDDGAAVFGRVGRFSRDHARVDVIAERQRSLLFLHGVYAPGSVCRKKEPAHALPVSEGRGPV